MPDFNKSDWNTFVYGEYTFFFSMSGFANIATYVGNDTDPNTAIYGNSGTEYVRAGGGDDLIFGNAGNDDLYGGGGDDVVDGGSGNDIISTSTGNDELSGGTGSDTLALSANSSAWNPPGWHVSLQTGTGYQVIGTLFDPNLQINTVTLSEFENVTGSSGDDYIEGDDADNILRDGIRTSSWDDDVIYGFGGDDQITVHGGTDIVDGGDGEDRIIAHGYNMDDHQLTGGDDADVFVFDFTRLGGSDSDFYPQRGKAATITDFDWREGDKVEVAGDYVVDLSNGSDAALIGQASVWQDLYSQTTARLKFDHDGDRVADTWIYLEDAHDFLITEDLVLV